MHGILLLADLFFSDDFCHVPAEFTLLHFVSFGATMLYQVGLVFQLVSDL